MPKGGRLFRSIVFAQLWQYLSTLFTNGLERFRVQPQQLQDRWGDLRGRNGLANSVVLNVGRSRCAEETVLAR
jgi:hypothetical protein